MRAFRLITATCALFLLGSGALLAQTSPVSGKVLDEWGEPLPGVGVVEKNRPTNGVVTDIDGQYTINVRAGAFLEFSCLGYETLLEDVKERSMVNVSLKMAVSKLNDVVVIGYGESRKVDLTGSVAVVDVEKISEGAAMSVDQALQGRIAGADFSSRTGEPGEAASILIRGSRSISAGNEPLIIVDGMLDVVEDLTELNPADITSISVLKDVSSTAIYGSRGANGVILVTTQAIKPNVTGIKPVVKFSSKVGVSAIAGKLDLMNASEFATWRNMVWHASKEWADGEDMHYYSDPASFGKGTDWVNALSRTAIQQSYNLSVNGRNSNYHYYASIGYSDEEGIIIGSASKKINGNASYDAAITSWLRAGVTTKIVHNRVDATQASISGTSTSSAIYLSPLLTIEDTWNAFGDDESMGGAIFNNPYIRATTAQKWWNRDTFSISPWAKLKFTGGLSSELKFSYLRNNTWSFEYAPSTLPVAAYNHTGGTANRSSYLKQNLIGEGTLSWKKAFGRHDVNLLAGGSLQMTRYDQEKMSGTGYMDDNVGFYNMAGIYSTANITPTSYTNIVRKASVFGRADYTWGRRYHVTATLRADGSSNFAVGRKWGFFPALAFRWSIMNEPWFASTWWLNDLSIRTSVGRSGNDAISSYMSLATITPGRTHYIFGDERVLAYTPSKLANSGLSWETTDAVNLGFNLDIFGSRVVVEGDAYLSRTTDLLLSMRTSSVTGYTNYLNNFGKTQNMGVELSIETKNILSRSFSWSTTFTIAHNKQIVLEAGEGDAVVPTYSNPRNSSQYLYGYRKGYPVNSLWGYQFEGVWKNAGEIERNNYTHAYSSGYMSNSVDSNLGRSKYVDVNHDGLLDEEDVVWLGCSDPVVYGGLQNDFSIGSRLKIGIFFAYSIGGSMYNISELWLGTGAASNNKYRYMLSAWSPENEDSDIPAAYRDDYHGSSRFIHDASYLRLKTLSIDYSVPLPRSWAKVIKGLGLGLVGENLWLLKSYNGFDPDVNSSSAVYRLDTGAFPRPRTIMGKVSLVF